VLQKVLKSTRPCQVWLGHGAPVNLLTATVVVD
jgi:hypothetical protein